MFHHHIPYLGGKTANLKVAKCGKCGKVVASFLEAAVLSHDGDGALVGHVMLCVHVGLVTAAL